jgi:hypothetical protein
MMSDQFSFPDRIRERYPEGLTGIIAIGGTRTTYILEHNRENLDPGQISEFSSYGKSLLARYFNLVKMFYELGGQNLVVPILAYQLFYGHGEQYGELVSRLGTLIINEESVAFYRDNMIDPYFAGIDTLLQLPHDQAAYQLGAELAAFQNTWVYETGRRKLIWEIAPIPLFSFWRSPTVMGETTTRELEKALSDATDMTTMHDLLYRYYARAVYGTELPTPHFYLGTNRNGDLKLRALLPIAMLCGGPFRLFYTPYPTLFITYETLQAVLEDLAFGKPLRSTTMDYTGQYTSELVEAEYERVLQLSSDPESTIGLTRNSDRV